MRRGKRREERVKEEKGRERERGIESKREQGECWGDREVGKENGKKASGRKGSGREGRDEGEGEKPFQYHHLIKYSHR